MCSDIVKPTNVVWHYGHVQHQERSQLFGRRPSTIWLTGVSASGKSTLAFDLASQLTDMGHACYVLGRDNIRHGLNKNVGFSPGIVSSYRKYSSYSQRGAFNG